MCGLPEFTVEQQDHLVNHLEQQRGLMDRVAKGQAERIGRKQQRRLERLQVREAVASGQAAGIIPTGLIWLLVKWAVEAFIRRYFFGTSK